MATDPYLLERIRKVLKEQKTAWTEKSMFGGDCFMVDDKMCIGTYKGGIMARVDPDKVDELAKHEGAEQMIHGGRPMKGYLFINQSGFDKDDHLEHWVRECLEFNPRAKASKKK
ncbi:MAG: TfoX/Sxy family protein [Cyclobacteriaceae bacterium]